MILLTVERSVIRQVSFRAVILLWLICLVHGRFISNNENLEAEELRDREINKISGVENRGLSDNLEEKVEVRDPRLSELEWSTYSVHEPNGPGTFAFGYDNVVDSAGNEHYRTEERFENGTVIGEYGYTDYGIKRVVHVSYTADHRGYRAKTELLPLEGSS